ncbi:glycosyltransferase family 4 protein [Fulvivirga sp. 29W222]|uniref:Glycosyltransferase family 4 protein n=1 Tax=Fulvivirga marina TaxID=2494733 RepID=A0A937G1H8_9BACT|nr:glycosyltransferase family 4 protein [Fulvivirga marina]MBL6448343.1 glycosyltransferase family 4 protein [Fulvivirga marina]
MKKVLIITYYWPPSGGSGVQRWLKFAKYLPQHGWEPVIFTPENPSFEVEDASLVADVSKDIEVVKLPIWEPYVFVNKIKNKNSKQSDLVKKKDKGLLTKMVLWLRGNLFIPDPRVFWVKPAVKVLQDFVSTNNIDVIVTTGPPHSMHLIGLQLKHRTGVKWLADFRDPWSTWSLFDNFYLTSWVRKRHRKLESKVLKYADVVTTVSKYCAKEISELGNREVKVITNGFDDADFQNIERRKPEEFIIRHIGLIDEVRPQSFLTAVKQLTSEGLKLQVEFIGSINQALKHEVQEDPLLKNVISFVSYIPHEQVLKLYQQTAVLLLITLNSQNDQGTLPGKFFEYLASGRPILAIGPTDGDLSEALRNCNAGNIAEFDDVEAIKSYIRNYYVLHQQNALEINTSEEIACYSRSKLTEGLAKILNNMGA